jgi:hypothetical protein
MKPIVLFVGATPPPSALCRIADSFSRKRWWLEVEGERDQAISASTSPPPTFPTS